MIAFDEIEQAAARVRPYIHRTPLIHSASLSRMSGAEVYVKAENLQKTGSFKVRGAFNKMLTAKTGRVIAASMGNHAQAVAFAGTLLGIRTMIVMPETVSIVKEQATRAYGADIDLHGESFQDAYDYALSRHDYAFISAFDDDAVIAGQGTIGLEIMEQIEEPAAVIVPVGGGGLIAGISIAVRTVSPSVEVIGVQAEAAPSAFLSLREGRRCEKTPLPTIADGIAVGKVGEKTLDVIREWVNDIVLVDDDQAAQAILLFMERMKLVAEGAGATPLAALLANEERFRGRKVVLVVSGGNIDLTLVDRMIYRGMVKSGRVGIFEVIVDDIPGSLHTLTGIISSRRGNVLNVTHDRLRPNLPIGKTLVIFTVESRTREHLEELLCAIEQEGFQVGRGAH